MSHRCKPLCKASQLFLVVVVVVIVLSVIGCFLCGNLHLCTLSCVTPYPFCTRLAFPAVLRDVHQPPFWSHHHRIAYTDGSDSPWMVQQEPHRPPSCKRSHTGSTCATPSPRFSSSLRTEQRRRDAPWTCSDAAPALAHLCVRQSHTCVPAHLCHVVVSLHPDMIRTRLVVLGVSFRVCYMYEWNEIPTAREFELVPPVQR